MTRVPVSVVRADSAGLVTAAALQRQWLPEVDLTACLAHPKISPMLPDDVLLLAVDGKPGKPVGFLFASAPHDDDGAGHVWVLVVAKPYRRRGIGEALIREYALIAERAGTDVVWVDPVEGPRERELIGYYTRLGWTDRTGWADSRTEYRQEQMHATVASILAAVGRDRGGGRWDLPERLSRSG